MAPSRGFKGSGTREAALTVAALPVDRAAAQGFGLMRTDAAGRILEFREKHSGEALEAMRVDTGSLGLSASEAEQRPFLASMGIYVFNRDTLFNFDKQAPTYTRSRHLPPSQIREAQVHRQSLRSGLRLAPALSPWRWRWQGARPEWASQLHVTQQAT